MPVVLRDREDLTCGWMGKKEVRERAKTLERKAQGLTVTTSYLL